MANRKNTHMLDSLLCSISGTFVSTVGVDEMFNRVIWHSKKHILDINYPHSCFICKEALYWEELFSVNMEIQEWSRGNYKTYKQIKKLWRSQVIEFYCCNCFNLIPNNNHELK